MQSIRQKQVAEVIRRDMSTILQQEGRYIYGKALVTLTHVRMTPDLAVARIYCSVYNAEDKQAVVDSIGENVHRLRTELYKKVGKQFRIMPSIEFFIDDTLDETARLDEIFAAMGSTTTVVEDVLEQQQEKKRKK